MQMKLWMCCFHRVSIPKLLLGHSSSAKPLITGILEEDPSVDNTFERDHDEGTCVQSYVPFFGVKMHQVLSGNLLHSFGTSHVFRTVNQLDIANFPKLVACLTGIWRKHRTTFKTGGTMMSEVPWSLPGTGIPFGQCPSSVAASPVGWTHIYV